jgi:predicted nucleic acid-binding protein
VGLREDLPPGPIALDTVVFIYFIEENPRFLSVIDPVFADIDTGKRTAVTSAITLLEVLVVPYRAGDFRLAERYEALLTRSRGLRLIDVDRDQLRGGAELRARFRLRTPDALQLGAALSGGCEAFVTNDRSLDRLPGLSVFQLSDYAVT